MSAKWRLLCRIALTAILLELLAAERTELKAQNPADPTRLQGVDFTLADIAYQILVPQGAPVRLPNEQIRFIEIRYPRLTRSLRLFRIGPLVESQDKYARLITLISGAVLEYNIDRFSGGGSGGPEAQLNGRLQIGTLALSVVCHDQREGFDSPDPEWCLPYLHHLTIYRAK
jgi:hypothetical protein